ncbi:Ldh family oxidoreductase [Martelella endophytica]|uniref:Oxidoreductase n=1 Tax=Martelella endophytica TaxID=1486262 RepID=A0A0D5LNX5_MAREN|nr:Ldh family oxidoreductase [Martelella endophytica]AJY45919.1 oxidoreductase [Martelella endophytica]
MSGDTATISAEAAFDLGFRLLTAAGYSDDHARAITAIVVKAQGDECHSHGLYRIISCLDLIERGKVDPKATPVLEDRAPAIVRVDARRGISLLGFDAGLPVLEEKAKTAGIAALAINNCFHFSALWPEVEAIAERGLVAIAMTVSHAWVAPAGGSKPVFGTNPFAFGWPRGDKHPFVFDFATSAIARGDIELHRRSNTPLPAGVAIDRDGRPTTDPEAASDGAMLTFGGHKGSALSAMIELLAGPLIGDMTSAQSLAFDEGAKVTPCHGELVIALDPKSFLGAAAAAEITGGEALFDAISGQNARLPSARRYAARRRNQGRDMPVRRAVLDDLHALARRYGVTAG